MASHPLELKILACHSVLETTSANSFFCRGGNGGPREARGLARVLTVIRQSGMEQIPSVRGDHRCHPLPGNGMWIRPQRQSSRLSLRLVTRPWSVEFRTGAAGGRAEAGPWEFALPVVLPPVWAQTLPLLSVFARCPTWLGSWSLPCPRWRTEARGGNVLLRWDPGCVSGWALISKPAGGCLISLPGVSSLSVLNPTSCLPSSNPNNFCVPQELLGLWA